MKEAEKFLREINHAFAEKDAAFIIDRVTNDVTWKVIGEITVEGKADFTSALKRMEQMPPMKIKVNEIISHGDSAVVHGEVRGKNTAGQKKKYGFCDIYKLTGTEKPMIREMISYVVDISRFEPI